MKAYDGLTSAEVLKQLIEVPYFGRAIVGGYVVELADGFDVAVVYARRTKTTYAVRAIAYPRELGVPKRNSSDRHVLWDSKRIRKYGHGYATLRKVAGKLSSALMPRGDSLTIGDVIARLKSDEETRAGLTGLTTGSRWGTILA